jgi:hypothetical protein
VEKWFGFREDFQDDQLGVVVTAAAAYIVRVEEKLGQVERNQRDELRRAV